MFVFDYKIQQALLAVHAPPFCRCALQPLLTLLYSKFVTYMSDDDNDADGQRSYDCILPTAPIQLTALKKNLGTAVSGSRAQSSAALC